jgi:amino acid transporter
MAQDGMLPRVFSRVHPRTRAPWVAIVVCAVGWALCLGLGFERLVTIDVLIYGISLVLEFLALIVLRVREPNLARPFRVPGGMFGAVMIGVCPALLLGFSVAQGQQEQILGLSSLVFALLLIGGGVIAYGIKEVLRHSGLLAPTPERPSAG